jgi:cellulose synthase/poly-beta-1,6-N-acetylglucosamine synthase-like glycosyltransferase
MKLAILIPTLPERVNQFNRLLYELQHQCNIIGGDIAVLGNSLGREVPTGTKRNLLLRDARMFKADYICMVDDDDIVSHDYVRSIMEGVYQGVDVVTFNGYMTTNGAHRVDFEIRLGENYEERNGKYYRYPNHLCAFKRTLVEHVPFEDIYMGEDYRWATKVRDLGLLKTSYHIEKQIYHYDYKTK